MPTEAALLAAIIADPDDDTTRLVDADLLEEEGDEVRIARAQFIRAQVELARPVQKGEATRRREAACVREETECSLWAQGRVRPRVNPGTCHFFNGNRSILHFGNACYNCPATACVTVVLTRINVRLSRRGRNRPVLALAAAGNVQHLAVLGHRTPGHGVAVGLQQCDEFLIRQRTRLVLVRN